MVFRTDVISLNGIKVIVLVMKIRAVFCVQYDELSLKKKCKICFSEFLILYACVLLYNRSATSSLVGSSGFESEFLVIFSTSL